MADLVLTGIVRSTGGAQASATGFRVEGRVVRIVEITPGDPDTISVLNTGAGIVDGDGNFRLTLGGDGEPQAPVTVTVSAPDGQQLFRDDFTLEQAGKPLTLRVKGQGMITISSSDDPTRGGRLTLTGRVVDEKGAPVPSGLPIVIWAVAADDPAAAAAPLIVSKTQSGGWFSADWVATTLVSAYARVAGSDRVDIALEADSRLPMKLLLVLDVPEAEDAGPATPPLAASPTDLTTNPSGFSQDLGGGCVDLTTPNRAVEEFIYTMVVRTSEPEVRGVTLGQRRLVPPQFFGPLIEAGALQQVARMSAVGTVSADDVKDLRIDVETARQLVSGDDPPTVADLKRASWLSETSWLKDLIGGVVAPTPVRQPLDADHPIDWDDTPTIFEAINLARGHLLEFREVWRADGYSLGDLLHSLPLAPGQRRRVAIIDWERRSTTVREDALEFEEQLQAFTGRDRDVTEIVGSRLAEETAAGSSNTTWGAAGGIGLGFIGTGFGIFGGVAGSHGGSSSTAWQESSRSFSGDALQQLRDRVMQRSSAVRDQRATVVQTVAQGETLRATTETIGNYNHCHAMTVEYFEVLRHFLITHEMADVREVLFVPLPMREFDRAKVLRWQTPLVAHCADRALLPGFTAIRRIADNWVGWDYPVSRFSEEAPEYLDGELRMSFILPRPRDAEDGGFQLDEWQPWAPWLWMGAPELWRTFIQEGLAAVNAEAIARRDRQWQEKVAPEIARRMVAALRFSYVTEDGGEFDVPLDATLVSRYAEGTPLYVTLRPRGALPAIAREKISQFKISLKTLHLPFLDIPAVILPSGAQVVVTSGKVRYRTEHKQFVLFDDGRILNDLSNIDAVFIPTPTSWAERRNPREEDRRLETRLLAHLNNRLEFYHQVIWAYLDPQRRFMLLDGILVPGLAGKSVASVVENRVIGIAGNSMIFPVAPGVRIDPRVNTESEGSLRDLYASDAPPPIRVSVPTRGVYAEAILGDCDGCEEIDDSRYWRWTTEGMLNPPEIEPVSTASRADAEEPLPPTPLPKPLVSIQNAPELPAPVGLGDVFKVLARPDLFTDITGLEGTQKNARAAFDSALSAATSVAGIAAGLAKQNLASTTGERMLDRINQARQDGLLPPGAATDLAGKVLGTMIGKPDESADKKADSPAADPTVQKAIDKAAQSEKGAIKVSTADETVEMQFDGGDTKLGGGSFAVGLLELDGFVDQVLTKDDVSGTDGKYVITSQPFPTTAGLKKAFPTQVAAITGKFLVDSKADVTRYQVYRRLRIAYPADPSDPKKVALKGRLPIAVLVHGQHASWQGGGEVRNHDGYAFLQDHLAKLGIVSVSVDTNAANFFGSLIQTRAEMVLGALDTLKTMDQNPASLFAGRLDFDRIGLLGHSRGGDAVVRAAVLNKTAKRGLIRAVVSLAPTDFTGALAKESERMALDASHTNFYLVIYGGHDGDVSGSDGARGFGGTGFRHYDRASARKAMVYIPFCDHNRFNDTWSTDESGVLAGDIAKLHSRADHRQLLIEYAGAALEWQLTGTVSKSALFTGRASNSLGHDVSLQWCFGPALDTLETFEGNNMVAVRTVANADIAPYPDIVAKGAKLEPHTSHVTKILAVAENLAAAPPPALKLEFDAAHRNWSAYTDLIFNLGVWIDVSSEATINAASNMPVFDLFLTDGAGKSAKISSMGFTTPDIPGKPVFHQVSDWSPSGSVVVNASLHRFTTVAIELAPQGLKLDDIRQLQVVPDPAFKARYFFDAITLVKR